MKFNRLAGNWLPHSITEPINFKNIFNQPTQIDAEFFQGKQPQSHSQEVVEEFDLVIMGTDGLWDNIPPAVVSLLVCHAIQVQIEGNGADLDSEEAISELVGMYADTIQY